MWGAQEKSGGKAKNFRPALCAGIVPPTCKLLPTPLIPYAQMQQADRGGSTLGPGGTAPPPNVGQPPKYFGSNSKNTRNLGYFCTLAKSTLVSISAMMRLLTKIPMKAQIKP